jgi:hypothetical protein
MEKTMNENSYTTTISEFLLETLRKNNPFSSNAAAEPWSQSYPDVASINRDVFEDICTLIERKATAAREALAGMVLGAAGEGKTHLLRRILEFCKRSNPPSLFVFVKPLFDPKRPLHHLLQEIVLCLSKKNEGGDSFSQFERLIAEIIREYVRHRVSDCPQDATPGNKKFLEKFETNVFHIFDSEKVQADSMEEIFSNKVTLTSQETIERGAVRYIHSKVPETNKPFLDVIFQYKTPEKRGLVRDWLKGTPLDEDAYQMLGVPSCVGLSDEAREHETREMILTLGVLFARYRLPMVLCFDQLDNLIGPQLIASFASMIHLLVNDAANMLPLAFIRGDSWFERFRLSPDRAFIDRMESNQLKLSLCTKDDAHELVSRRIEYIFGNGTKETTDIAEWLLPQLESKLVGDSSPREVILVANRIIRDASTTSGTASHSPTVSESVAAEYKKACEAVAVDFDEWDPDSEYLKTAAKLFLKHQEVVLSCEPGNDKYMTWTGMLKTTDGDVPYACFINTTKNWQTVSAVLGRCIEFLQKNPNGVCSYVTDARYDFSPTWKATNERRLEVEALGGNVVVLDQPAAVRWYGLVSLSLKIGSGDIFLESEHGSRSALDADLTNFLKKDFSSHETGGAFDRLTKKKATPPCKPPIDSLPHFPPTDKLIEAMCTCLSESTFPVLTTEVLLAKLNEKGINVTLEYCLEQIGKNQNVISLLPAKDGFMVKLVV